MNYNMQEDKINRFS